MSTSSSVSLERFPILNESMCQLYQDIASYAWMQYRCVMTAEDCEAMLSEAKWNSVDDYIEHTRKVDIKRARNGQDVEVVAANIDQGSSTRDDGVDNVEETAQEVAAVNNVVVLGKYNVYTSPDEVDNFHLADGDDVLDVDICCIFWSCADRIFPSPKDIFSLVHNETVTGFRVTIMILILDRNVLAHAPFGWAVRKGSVEGLLLQWGLLDGNSFAIGFADSPYKASFVQCGQVPVCMLDSLRESLEVPRVVRGVRK
ncbi:hypothetical protein GGR57DRAFT_496748 [Xylariaceae sp. FL1272]|nr:hypothetical protein GGR57DRAFT_496748 [Xylariaceae sp. FL1272]